MMWDSCIQLERINKKSVTPVRLCTLSFSILMSKLCNLSHSELVKARPLIKSMCGGQIWYLNFYHLLLCKFEQVYSYLYLQKFMLNYWNYQDHKKSSYRNRKILKGKGLHMGFASFEEEYFVTYALRDNRCTVIKESL